MTVTHTAETPTPTPVGDDRGPGRTRRRGRVVVPLLVVAVLAGGGVAVVAHPWDHDNATTKQTAVRHDFVPVEHGSLSTSIQLTGSLAFDAPTPIVASGKGTITALPAVGAIVKTGGKLYEVDGQPVVLMTGDRPMWRDLGPDVPNGPDVEQLKKNLIKLGHAKGLDLSADQKFTTATVIAVKRWQKSLGVKETGTVPLGGIVMLAQESVRIQQLGAKLGSAVGSDSIMTVTRTDLVVTAQPADNQVSRFKPDGKVRVKLSDGTAVEGRIRSLARGPAGDDKSGGSADGPNTKTTVTIVLDSQDKTQQAGPSPVTVNVVGDTADNALIVPVTALLALDGGGYGIRVADGPTTRLVKVRLGLIADAKAQITGDVQPGAQVAIPT
ncbi:peptidoglycan-binding protein [Embleya sp. NPDC059237]|uniref:peptidoglycan-binding protein n=1 Tax=Embleya sp. NPDC059237 TaxID=3346784 RepID=UPI0036779AE4